MKLIFILIFLLEITYSKNSGWDEVLTYNAYFGGAYVANATLSSKYFNDNNIDKIMIEFKASSRSVMKYVFPINDKITIMNGKYGPYIKYSTKSKSSNYKIIFDNALKTDKDKLDFLKNMTLSQCENIISNKKTKTKPNTKSKSEKTKLESESKSKSEKITNKKTKSEKTKNSKKKDHDKNI